MQAKVFSGLYQLCFQSAISSRSSLRIWIKSLLYRVSGMVIKSFVFVAHKMAQDVGLDKIEANNSKQVQDIIFDDSIGIGATNEVSPLRNSYLKICPLFPVLSGEGVKFREGLRIFFFPIFVLLLHYRFKNGP